MTNRTLVLLVVLAALVVGGTIVVHLPEGRPSEYRTILIEGYTKKTRFGAQANAAYELPNVASTLNDLRKEGWRVDRLLLDGGQILVVATRD